MVTTVVTATVNGRRKVMGGDDARRAEWIPAGSYDKLVTALRDQYDGQVFRAHRDLLATALSN